MVVSLFGGAAFFMGRIFSGSRFGFDQAINRIPDRQFYLLADQLFSDDGMNPEGAIAGATMATRQPPLPVRCVLSRRSL